MLDPEVQAAFRRRSLADALAGLCVEKGYRATTIADVASRARSSRATIYDHFENSEQIFLAILDRAIPELLSRTEAACQAAAPEQAVEAGLSAVLDWIAEEPAAAWACFVESLCATPESLRRYLEAITEFTALLRGNVPTEVPRPATTEESLIGGVAAILRHRIQNGEAERVPELLPALSGFLRAPFLATGSL